MRQKIEQLYWKLFWKSEKSENKIQRIILLWCIWYMRIIDVLKKGRYYIDGDEVWDRLTHRFTGVYININKNPYINREESIIQAENYFGKNKIQNYIFYFQDGHGCIITSKSLLKKANPLSRRGLYKILIPTYETGGLFASSYKEANERILSEREELRKKNLETHGCIVHVIDRNYWVEYR